MALKHLDLMEQSLEIRHHIVRVDVLTALLAQGQNVVEQQIPLKAIVLRSGQEFGQLQCQRRQAEVVLLKQSEELQLTEAQATAG